MGSGESQCDNRDLHTVVSQFVSESRKEGLSRSRSHPDHLEQSCPTAGTASAIGKRQRTGQDGSSLGSRGTGGGGAGVVEMLGPGRSQRDRLEPAKTADRDREEWRARESSSAWDGFGYFESSRGQ